MSTWNGVIVIDKPAGVTSTDVVNQVKRALKVKRVGHTGTLDPMATGVLPLCLGQATKIAGYLLAEDKVYEGELLLGVKTDTLDAQGQVTGANPEGAKAVTRARLEAVMVELTGPGQQIPPMFSALKHRGKRLYELARAGQIVDRPPRPIVIHELSLRGFDPPRAQFLVHCSKGTYVRSLVAELGAKLGCGAHLTALRRVRSGAFALESALALAEVTPDSVRARLIAPAAALGHLPAVSVTGELARAVGNGQRITWARLAGAGSELSVSGSEPSSSDSPSSKRCGALMRVLGPGGALLALATVAGDGMLRYERVFTYDLT
jgi:tRNA pseudouridine55 synthase